MRKHLVDIISEEIFVDFEGSRLGSSRQTLKDLGGRKRKKGWLDDGRTSKMHVVVVEIEEVVVPSNLTWNERNPIFNLSPASSSSSSILFPSQTNFSSSTTSSLLSPILPLKCSFSLLSFFLSYQQHSHSLLSPLKGFIPATLVYSIRTSK